MKFFGRALKYLLRSVFSIIIFLLLVGWAKMNRDMGAYVSFLNTNDWSVFHWSQPATWSDPFWQNNQISGDIADMLSGDNIDAELSGLDVYDPAFEEDLNEFTDTSLSGTNEEEFGFSADAQTGSGVTSKAELLNVIKKSELKK